MLDFSSIHLFCQVLTKAWRHPPHTVYHLQVHTYQFIGLHPLVLRLPSLCVLELDWRKSGQKSKGLIKEWKGVKKKSWSSVMYVYVYVLCYVRIYIYVLCALCESEKWRKTRVVPFRASFAFLNSSACLQSCIYPKGLVAYFQVFTSVIALYNFLVSHSPLLLLLDSLSHWNSNQMLQME